MDTLTYRAWRRTIGPFLHQIKMTTEMLPEKLGPDDVLIRIPAVGLNFRDPAMLEQGGYPMTVEDGGIPGTDCAAEVVSIDGDVTVFVISDRVAPNSDLMNITGHERDAAVYLLGANAPGVLREYAILRR